MHPSDKEIRPATVSQEIRVQHTQDDEYRQLYRKHTLFETAQEASSETWKQWLQQYAGSLKRWELSHCKDLVDKMPPLLNSNPAIIALFQKGTQAIEQQRYQEALEMLECLIAATVPGTSLLDKGTLATLLVITGRIFLYKAADSETARIYFERARELMPIDGLSYAALGDYHKYRNDFEEAEHFYIEAIRQKSGQVHGYLGRGLLAEAQDEWNDANDCYEDAVQAVENPQDFEVILHWLLTPISGNVYWQFARKLKEMEKLEHALEAVTKALEKRNNTGIKGAIDYPERFAYKLQGEILVEQSRPREAAKSYYEAAWRFSNQSNFSTARALLERAYKLKSDDADICWELADVLRMSSYPTTPSNEEDTPSYDEEETDWQEIEQLLRESLKYWELAYALGVSRCQLPRRNLRWLCFERALINEQLKNLPGNNRDEARLCWEAIRYLERAVRYGSTPPDFWRLLGSFYYIMDKNENALNATEKAIDSSDQSLIVQNQKALILMQLGRLNEAEEVINRQRKLSWSAELEVSAAYIHFYKGNYEGALKHIKNVIEDKQVPKQIRYYDLCATCYFMLGEPANARKAAARIWQLYEKAGRKSTNEDLCRIGKAACYLDKLDESIAIFCRLCENNAGNSGVYCWLGFAYFLRGDLQNGKVNLDKGIDKATRRKILEEVVRVNIPIVKQLATDKPFCTQICATLDQFQEAILHRYSLAEHDISRDDELKQVLEEERDEDILLAAQAGLARFYLDTGQWNSAKDMYRCLLEDHKQRFPEAKIGLERVAIATRK